MEQAAFLLVVKEISVSPVGQETKWLADGKILKGILDVFSPHLEDFCIYSINDLMLSATMTILVVPDGRAPVTMASTGTQVGNFVL